MPTSGSPRDAQLRRDKPQLIKPEHERSGLHFRQPGLRGIQQRCGCLLGQALDQVASEPYTTLLLGGLNRIDQHRPRIPHGCGLGAACTHHSGPVGHRRRARTRSCSARRTGATSRSDSAFPVKFTSQRQKWNTMSMIRTGIAARTSVNAKARDNVTPNRARPNLTVSRRHRRVFMIGAQHLRRPSTEHRLRVKHTWALQG